ncbi:MAG TPA: PAS domain S-box protein [Blastocatellia bacterium]
MRESQKSVEAVPDSEARFRAIFENAAVGISRVAPDGRLLEVNQRLCDIVGYTREELMTKTFADITHPEDLKADLRAMRRMLGGEIETYLREKRYYRKDGSIVWVNLTVSMSRKADGSPDYFISVIEDISARKLAEEKLHENEERLLLASEAAGLGVFEWDMQADRTVWENERMYEIFGHTHADGALSKAQFIERYVHPDDAPTLEQKMTDGMKSMRPVHTGFRIRRKDGALRWLDLSASFELARDQTPIRILGMLADITERKQIEESLRESQERLQIFIEHAPVPLAMFDREMRYLAASRRWMTDYRLGDRDIRGQSHYALFPEVPERWKAVHRRTLEGEIVRADEDRFVRADGEVQWVRWETRPWHAADGAIGGIVIFSEEITDRKLASEALRESELRFRTMISAIPNLSYETDADGANIFTSDQWRAYTGMTEEESAVAGFIRAYHPDEAEDVLAQWSAAVRLGASFERKCRIRAADGSYRWFLNRAQPGRDAEGRLVRWAGSLTDIDDLIRAEERARENELRFRTMISAVPSLTFEADVDGNNTFASDQWRAYTGMTAEETAGRGFVRAIHPDDVEEVTARWFAAMRSGTLYESRHRMRAADGSYRWFLCRALPARDAEGRIVRWAGSLADIDDLVRAGEALRESEGRFRQLAESLPQLVWTCRADGTCDYISPQFVAYTGIPEAKQLGFDWLQQVHPDDREPLFAAWNRTVATGEPFDVEYRIRRNDGVFRWFKTRATALRDSGGKVVKWFGSNTDIDDQKQAERSSLESKERLNGIVSSAMDAIITVDEEQRIVLFNEAAERMFGCPGVEAMGRPLDRFIPERFRVTHNDGFLRFGEIGGLARLTALTALRADGAEFPIEASISNIEVGGRKLFTVILRDITERRQAEAEREQLAREQTARAEAEYAAEKIRRLQAVIDSVLAHLTLENLLTEMLNRIRELLETDSAAILLLSEDGQSLVMRAAIGSQEEVIGMRIPLGQGVSGSIAASRAPLVVEDLSAVEVINPVLRREARSLIGAPLIVKGELIGVIHADTAKLKRFAENDVRLLQLAADRVALAIEQRRLYEVEQQARRQAEEANRTKDEFLAIVSHELRSPLNAILGYTRMLRSGPEDREGFNKVTGVIERSAKAQLQIIEDLLDSARIVTGKLRIEPSLIDLVPALEAALDTVRSAAEAKGITLVANFSHLPEQVLGDSTRLQQVVWNLLTNAVKFTQEGGRVELRMEGAADHIRIAVSDTGKGIEPEFLPFVFDRFRQADSSSGRRYGGLGLGLSLVKHLVELHGGTITAASEGAGRGTTFTITLPRRHLELIPSPSPAVTSREVRVEDAIPRDQHLSLEGLSVLVVDDQEEARVVLTHALSEYGAQVTTASSGAEALAILSRPLDGRRPDALILDIAMPGEDGYDVLKKMRALEVEQGAVVNQIPAIALTAHARVEDRVRALNAGFQMHVAKPVEPTELAVVILSLIKRSDIKPGS